MYMHTVNYTVIYIRTYTLKNTHTYIHTHTYIDTHTFCTFERGNRKKPTRNLLTSEGFNQIHFSTSVENPLFLVSNKSVARILRIAGDLFEMKDTEQL